MIASGIGTAVIVYGVAIIGGFSSGLTGTRFAPPGGRGV